VVSGRHSRAARALLGWSQKELAERAHVGLRLLIDFEKGAKSLTPAGMVALEKTLSDHGIVLIDDGDWVGVKVKLTGRK
jgi:transcriptional regulator with XRE-family HTH domain